ncbi:MAG: AI-2E family transporter [Gammaproteobacteria bacterium]|nr:AI-2E family transporter [Gammaproteobacteria bacterium]
MNDSTAARFESASWVVFGGGLLLLLYLHLLPALLAGLFVFALVNALVRPLRIPALGRGGPRLLAVTIIAAVLLALLTTAGLSLSSFLRNSEENVPALIQRMAEILENSRGSLPPWVLENTPADAEELRIALVNWLRGHTDMFQMAGAGLGRGLAHVLIGLVIGALLSLETAIPVRSFGPLTSAFAHRGLRLSLAFRRVVFAQIWISSINTALTGFYLAVVLPQFDVNLPFTKTLIVITFVAGLIPILGNLISNTMIFTVSLSHSLIIATGSLLYLIVIHKLEYFLNARIIGGHIRARAWELLIAMLVMEAAFGIAGLIAAPIYYAYLKDELRSRALI